MISAALRAVGIEAAMTQGSGMVEPSSVSEAGSKLGYNCLGVVERQLRWEEGRRI